MPLPPWRRRFRPAGSPFRPGQPLPVFQELQAKCLGTGPSTMAAARRLWPMARRSAEIIFPLQTLAQMQIRDGLSRIFRDKRVIFGCCRTGRRFDTVQSTVRPEAADRFRAIRRTKRRRFFPILLNQPTTEIPFAHCATRRSIGNPGTFFTLGHRVAGSAALTGTPLLLSHAQTRLFPGTSDSV